jgi:uncharacterized repeat protein (TIGR01451 family)
MFMRKLALLLLALVLPVSLILFARPVSAAIDTTRDCDTVAIIKCGSMTVSELQGDVKQGDVPTVYANFGINQNQLNGFVDGVVWKDGRVTLGTKGQGQLVATNAVTAGRWNNPTSDMTKIPNTDRAYRMSTSHFVDDGQIAFIKMVNGKFIFAVIKTCGNPVTAKPVVSSPPNLTVTKDVRTIKNTNWAQSVTVKPGENIAYRVIGTNTGKTTLENVSFRDVLPQGITFNMSDGHARLNGQYITNNLADGMNIGSLAPGQKFELEYAADTSASEARKEACSTGLTNRAFVKATGLTERSDTAVVKICAPVVATPIYSCDLLKGNTDSNRTFGITSVSTTAKNGPVLNRIVFDWGDGQSTEKKPNEVTGTVHQYSQDGTYTIRATTYFTLNGTEVADTSNSCTNQVTFKENKPPVVTTPTTPGKLVDTGPGTIIGAIASAITGGMLAYRFIWLRRFN